MQGFFYVTAFLIGNYQFYNQIKINLKQYAMRQNVVEFFQNLPIEKSEQFNKAFELYRKSPNKNTGVERSLNVQGYSERTLENLLYDLQKLHGITDLEKVAVAKSDVSSEESEVITISEGVVTDVENIVVVSEIVSEESEKTEDSSLSLREEFPFLNSADCPNELKILVADKITAWKIYNENHAKLLKIEAGELEVSVEEQTEIARLATEAFDENQKIYDELNTYKETGKVLGVHPLFKSLQMQREVEEMDQAELIAYKNSSAKYFSTNKTALAKAEANKDEEKIEEIKTRVAEREQKLAMVNKKLGVPTK